MTMGPDPLPLEMRMFPKILLPNEVGGCLVWTAAVDRRGYGRIRVRGTHLRAHRVMYELLVGPIPEGLQLDHLCRNTSCVRPDHLEPVTGRVNTLRGNTVSAANAIKTHCIRGHEFSVENTYVTPTGKRKCRTCQRRIDLARYYAKRRSVQTKAGLE